MACILFSSADIKARDSQAYRNMDMARERISYTFDPWDMLLSLQIGFGFVRPAMACAILESINLRFEPLSETVAPRYLKLVTIPSFCSLTLISLWMSLALFVISLVFSALISILYLVQVLSRLWISSCSCRIGWLVVLVLTALWDSISVYIGPSPREREKEKRNDRREKKCPNTPARTYCKRSKPLPYSDLN